MKTRTIYSIRVKVTLFPETVHRTRTRAVEILQTHLPTLRKKIREYELVLMFLCRCPLGYGGYSESGGT
jgi:hypothetical protein